MVQVFKSAKSGILVDKTVIYLSAMQENQGT